MHQAVDEQKAARPLVPANRILAGDCLQHLAALPPGCVDLAFADPPFNIGYEYDRYDDRRGKAEYLEWTERWLAAVHRTLSPSGSFFVAIGDEQVAEVKVRMDALGMAMRNWIVWHYTFGVCCKSKFSRSHAHILYYVMDPKRYAFDAASVKVPSARQEIGDKRASAGGKVPDDVWVTRPLHAPDGSGIFAPDGDTWAISRVCGTFKERTGHPCQMGEAVLERIVRVASRPGQMVLDPFAGSGTTLAVAKRLGRRWLGVELSEAYAEAARKRLEGVREAA